MRLIGNLIQRYIYFLESFSGVSSKEMSWYSERFEFMIIILVFWIFILSQSHRFYSQRNCGERIVSLNKSQTLKQVWKLGICWFKFLSMQIPTCLWLIAHGSSTIISRFQPFMKITILIADLRTLVSSISFLSNLTTPYTPRPSF